MELKMEDLSIGQLWREIENAMNDNPAPIQGMNVVYQFDLSGEDGGVYQLQIADGKAEASEGSGQEAQCILGMKTADFRKLLAGNLNSTAAYMMGKLKVKGNIGLALKMEGLLKQYDVR